MSRFLLVLFAACGRGTGLVVSTATASPGPAAAGPITVRSSIGSAGVQGNSESVQPAISSDGRFVAFASDASNVVPGDTNKARDIFVRDRQTGLTTRVSLTNRGGQANGRSYTPSISGDGRFVTFSSEATNLVAGDTNRVTDIFIRDRVAGLTRRVSVSTANIQANGRSIAARVTSDGRFVTYASDASNLAPDDTNGLTDVFVRDRLAGTTSRIAVPTLGGEFVTGAFGPAISGSGRYIAYAACCTKFLGARPNEPPPDTVAVYLYDRSTGVSTQIVPNHTQNPNGGGGVGGISGDGRYVAYSCCDNGETGTLVYSYDRTSKVSTRVGSRNNDSVTAISTDGRFIAFTTPALVQPQFTDVIDGAARPERPAWSVSTQEMHAQTVVAPDRP